MDTTLVLTTEQCDALLLAVEAAIARADYAANVTTALEQVVEKVALACC